VQEFFLSGKLLNNINSNILVLIPKKPGDDALQNFRPIALANFLLGYYTLNSGKNNQEIDQTINDFENYSNEFEKA